MVKIGDKIRIVKMYGEPQYSDVEGFVLFIDDANQIHGSWGSCAIIPETDEFIIIKKA